MRIGLLWIAAGEGLEVGLELYRRYTEPWLKEMGCTHLKIEGRAGWGRILSDYEEKARVFIKELT